MCSLDCTVKRVARAGKPPLAPAHLEAFARSALTAEQPRGTAACVAGVAVDLRELALVVGLHHQRVGTLTADVVTVPQAADHSPGAARSDEAVDVTSLVVRDAGQIVDHGRADGVLQYVYVLRLADLVQLVRREEDTPLLALEARRDHHGLAGPGVLGRVTDLPHDTCLTLDGRTAHGTRDGRDLRRRLVALPTLGDSHVDVGHGLDVLDGVRLLLEGREGIRHLDGLRNVVLRVRRGADLCGNLRRLRLLDNTAVRLGSGGTLGVAAELAAATARKRKQKHPRQ